MPPVITSVVADYGTRSLITTKAVQKNMYSYSAAMLFSDVDTSTIGAYRSPITNVGHAFNEVTTSNAYTPGSASVSADVLPIDRRAIWSESIGSFDEMSFASGSLIADRALNASKVMAQSIDRFVINKAIGDAGASMGNGGTIGSVTPWTVSATNALDIVNAGVEQINFNEGYGEDKFVLVDPSYVRFLTGYFQATGNNVADETIRKGVPYVGTLAGGVKVFQSNNVPSIATLTFSSQPANGDQVRISVGGGVVTHTFVSAIGTTSGNVLIGAAATNTQANYLSALQNPTTTSATQVALTGDQLNWFRGLAGTYTSASTVITLTTQATFRLNSVVIATGAASTAVVASAVTKRLLFGAMRSVKVFMPSKGMKYQEKDAISGFDGAEIFMRQFFNSMTETRKKPLTVSIFTN